MTEERDPNSKLLLETNLQGFFYDELQKVNFQSGSPLPTEAIFYSSKVMDQLGNSQAYFETVEGKVRDKVLGPKFLECSKFTSQTQIRVLKDVGDTALILCGIFSESLNRKLVDSSYYKNLGQMAYQRLNGLVPKFYEMESFYELLSGSFNALTALMSLASKNIKIGPEGKAQESSYFILNEEETKKKKCS